MFSLQMRDMDRGVVKLCDEVNNVASLLKSQTKAQQESQRMLVNVVKLQQEL